MRMLSLLTALFAAAALLPLAAGGSPEAEPPSIAVQGTGQVEAAPDTLIVEGGVSVLAETAIAAAEGARVEMQRVMDALAAAGVDPSRIETTQLSIFGETVPGADRSGDAQLRYRARNIVRVRSPEVGQAGELIDVLVSSGVNQLMGVRFSVADTRTYREAAWRAAVADARRQAEVIAAELGRAPGAVLDVVAGGGGGPGPQATAMMRSADAATPVSPGAITFTQTVRVVFALRQP